MRYILAHGLVQASLLSIASASPAPTAFANNVAPPDPVITPSPVEHNPSPIVGRNILSDVESDAGNVLSDLGSGLPSWVASGVPNFFQGFPTGDAVVSTLGLHSSELEALPTNVLNIDPYANWTNSGWNVRFHGNVYKQPNTSVSRLNDLADIFLVNTSISDLPKSQQAQARNLTAEIFVVQQPEVAVNKIHLKPAASQGSSGQPGGGGSSNTTGGTQDITLPYNTTVEGDFDTFVPIKSNGLTAGNETSAIQRLDTHVEGASIGNATAYLVPPTGLTIISDIDDILRVTKIYEPEQGLINSFARPFTSWEDMTEIYRNWSISLPDTHFHYLVSPLAPTLLLKILIVILDHHPRANYQKLHGVHLQKLPGRLLRHPSSQLQRRFCHSVDPQVLIAEDFRNLPGAQVCPGGRHQQQRRHARLPKTGHRLPRTSPVHLPPQHLGNRPGRQVPIRHVRIQGLKTVDVHVLPALG